MNSVEAYPKMILDQSWVQLECDSSFRPRLPENSPPTSLLFSEMSYHEVCSVSSGHDVKIMVIHSKLEKGQIVYFKKCDSTYPPILAQIEAASSASCRLSRGECTAKVRPVVDDNGEVIGTASYQIPTFRSFTGETLSAAVMLRMGVIDELVARYVRMEDDLHPDQIGFARNLGIVGLDFDMMWFGAITWEIKGARIINNGYFAPLPPDAFPITDEDINRFPDIKDAQPCYWPTKIPNNYNLKKCYANRDEFLKLASDSVYAPVKYMAFLREVLIDTEEHIAVMIPHFARNGEGVAMVEKMKSCIESRWALLEEALIDNEGFRKFIVKNKTAFHELSDHFRTYNEKIVVEGITVNLDLLETRYQELVRKCMVKDLTIVMFGLGCKLKNVSHGWEEFKLSYDLLIDICLRFKKNGCSFPDAFFTLECELRNQALLHEHKKPQWDAFCCDINIVLNNYRGLVTKRLGPPVQSIMIDRTRRDSMTHSDGSLNLEKCLARSLYSMVRDVKNHNKVIEVVQQVLREYAPIGYDSRIASLNPMRLCRSRSEAIVGLHVSLQKESPDQAPLLISKFLEDGAWNTSGYLRSASANVTLVRRLADKLLDGFKHQITLQQLREHDLVDLCYALDRGELDLEKSAYQIKELFREIIFEKNAAESCSAALKDKLITL
jgi:hypothetical protein